MTDEEIIEKAVEGINKMNLDRVTEEDREARKKRLIKIVMEKTGAEFFDASRYVSYAMLPRTTSGELLGEHYFWKGEYHPR